MFRKTWGPVWRHSTPAFELPRQLLRMKLYPLFHCCHVVIVVVEGKMGEKKIYFTHQCGPYLTITSIKMREKDLLFKMGKVFVAYFYGMTESGAA